MNWATSIKCYTEAPPKSRYFLLDNYLADVYQLLYMNPLTKRSQINIRLHRQELREFAAAARKERKHLSEWFRDLAREELERQRNSGKSHGKG